MLHRVMTNTGPVSQTAYKYNGHRTMASLTTFKFRLTNSRALVTVARHWRRSFNPVIVSTQPLV